MYRPSPLSFFPPPLSNKPTPPPPTSFLLTACSLCLVLGLVSFLLTEYFLIYWQPMPIIKLPSSFRSFACFMLFVLLSALLLSMDSYNFPPAGHVIPAGGQPNGACTVSTGDTQSFVSCLHAATVLTQADLLVNPVSGYFRCHVFVESHQS